MLRFIVKFWGMVLVPLSLPVILADYFHSDTGRDYQVGFWSKVMLAVKMIRNRWRIIGASNFLEHLVMATQILRVPKSAAGCVVECGTYKGASAASLSLVCASCDRRLEVFDSFEGLPEPSDDDKQHTVVDRGEVHTYSKGAWHGSLEEVKRNITRYGNINVCAFNPGYFEHTLPQFQKECVFAFVDVDLRESVVTVLRFLWLLLGDGCYLFVHEAHHMEIASLFFDEEWWRCNLRCKAPGLVGAGNGLGLVPASGGFKSALGYTVKQPRLSDFKIKPEMGI